jgi:hypothetical protein
MRDTGNNRMLRNKREAAGVHMFGSEYVRAGHCNDRCEIVKYFLTFCVPVCLLTTYRGVVVGTPALGAPAIASNFLVKVFVVFSDTPD